MFKRIPANKLSISRRNKILNNGVNDAYYKTSPRNQSACCPYYQKWLSMLKRCYSVKYQNRQPTYIGCTVCKEWLLFSNFRKWMEAQTWKGMELDKDIIVYNNKIYSPSTCCFVTKEINSLLNNHKNAKGKYPTGVSWHSATKKVFSQCSTKNGLVYLGCFDTISEAEKAYKQFKKALIVEIASNQTDIRIRNGLLIHAENNFT